MTRDARITKLKKRMKSQQLTRGQANAFDRLLEQQITRLVEYGARNSRTDAQRIQEVHDAACELGAKCKADMVPGVLAGVMGEAVIQAGPDAPTLEAWRGASAKGKRCVSKVMAQGKDMSAAIAICRVSLGEAFTEPESTQEAVPVKYQGIDFTPPEAVQKAAMRGLMLRRKYGRGGLDTNEAGEQGIGSGVARATTLASGKAVSLDTIRQMVAFFARHEKNLDTPPEKGNGMIAGLLWGGRPGMEWANSVKRRMDTADKRAEAILRAVQRQV
jgi:hypothetical protein